MNATVEHAPVGILEVDPDGTVRSLNTAAADLLGVEPGAATDRPVAAAFPDSVEAKVARAFETPPTDERSFEEYYPGPDRWLAVSLVPTGEAVALYVRDVSGRHRTERQLAERREDLTRLTLINELISEILGELVGATTREEIAETICQRLGEADICEFAWVGERDIGSDDMVLRAASGTTGRTLARIESCLDGDAVVPEQRAIESGDPEVVQPLGEAERVPERIRRAAFADGLQSVLAIPLTYGSNVYGVTGVYTAVQDAFSERERASFATVGEMAGFAVNAARHRNLLLSDTVVELSIRLSDPAAPLVGAARDHDVTVSLDGLVSQGESLLCYVVLEGTDPEAVASSLADHEGVTDTRVVGEYEGGGSVEVTLTPETPLGRVAARGATIQSAEFEPSGGDLVVEFSPEEETRRIAEAVTREYEASVVAKRERERDITTTQEFRDELGDRLTDRQESALRTAFFADYFESPRGSSAQEVAAALDITGPTLLHHLRAGQYKLLDEFFETTDGRAREDIGR